MNSFDLNTPLITFAGSPWTIRNAVEGTQIFGGIGSGKTSGSGRMLALKYLAAGFGGLVLTVKPDEKEVWEEYCALTGRSDDLRIIAPGGEHSFNFLEYESRGGNTENVVQVLQTVIQASEEKASGASQDSFWEAALDMLLSHVIDLCQIAYESVSVQQLYDIVQSLPNQSATAPPERNAFQEAMSKAIAKVQGQLTAWEERQSPEFLQGLGSQAAYEAAACADKDMADARLMKFVDQFFNETYLNLSEKTRSIIDFSFSGFLFRLLREPIYSLFCRDASTLTPEDCLEGKIIVLDLPVKIHHKTGRDSQILFKYIWQRAMEQRRIEDNGRPVFLWADEAQNFLHEYDAEYQATARSSRIATVYISQNLPNYHANMGGLKSEFRVKSFLGTLNTKVFHANADVETNRYASELIGDGFFEETSSSSTMTGSFSTSRTKQLKIDRIVRPEAFPGLKTGGDQNGGRVSAYIHFQGNVLQAGDNYTKAQFDQNYTPTKDEVLP